MSPICRGPQLPIPNFTPSYALPPFVGQWPTAPLGFAPYHATVAEVVAAFGTSTQRRALLVGLIDLREQLRNLGFTIQSQWLDGSFVEEIEASEARSPGDIDVVSFVERPALAKGNAQVAAIAKANLQVFDSGQSKAQFGCDHYVMDIDAGLSVEILCYWNALFSHRRNGMWKGYVSVADEGAAVDQAIRAALVHAGVGP